MLYTVLHQRTFSFKVFFQQAKLPQKTLIPPFLPLLYIENHELSDFLRELALTPKRESRNPSSFLNSKQKPYALSPKLQIAGPNPGPQALLIPKLPVLPLGSRCPITRYVLKTCITIYCYSNPKYLTIGHLEHKS